MRWILLVTLLAGCSVSSPATPEWNSAPIRYRCSREQMEKAEAEADWCITKTGYFSDFCYGTSIIRNCELPDSGQPP